MKNKIKNIVIILSICILLSTNFVYAEALTSGQINSPQNTNEPTMCLQVLKKCDNGRILSNSCQSCTPTPEISIGDSNLNDPNIISENNQVTICTTTKKCSDGTTISICNQCPLTTSIPSPLTVCPAVIKKCDDGSTVTGCNECPTRTYSICASIFEQCPNGNVRKSSCDPQCTPKSDISIGDTNLNSKEQICINQGDVWCTDGCHKKGYICPSSNVATAKECTGVFCDGKCIFDPNYKCPTTKTTILDTPINKNNIASESTTPKTHWVPIAENVEESEAKDKCLAILDEIMNKQPTSTVKENPYITSNQNDQVTTKKLNDAIQERVSSSTSSKSNFDTVPIITKTNPDTRKEGTTTKTNPDTLKQKTTNCIQYSPPAPGWCKGTTVAQPPINGCPQPAKCVISTVSSNPPVACIQYSPPPPGWCKGTIVSQPNDANNCPVPAKCVIA